MRTLGWQAAALVVILTGFAGVSQGEEPSSKKTSPTITVHVHDYAQVDYKTLMEAEKVATRIFGESGVETRWINASNNTQEGWEDERSSDLTRITLDILPHAMADHLQLSNEVMGLAPGVGRDRRIVYVFYNRIDRVDDTKLQLLARLGGIYVPTFKTFGHAIAHEIGHLLLNMEGHSKTGIMRGTWELDDLRDVALGRLFFTSQQAEAMRIEVARRVGQHETREVARFESPIPAR
jgi:hypothetical protein